MDCHIRLIKYYLAYFIVEVYYTFHSHGLSRVDISNISDVSVSIIGATTLSVCGYLHPNMYGGAIKKHFLSRTQLW